MRSVVEVITTRTPAACRRRATAKPIPSALPAPVITAVCLFNGRATNLPARRNHTWFGKDCDSSELVRFLAVAEPAACPSGQLANWASHRAVWLSPTVLRPTLSPYCEEPFSCESIDDNFSMT